MNKKDTVTFGLGVFVGLIILSMYFGGINWDIDASAIIATCAVFVAVWQGRSARLHNKLSVQPYLARHSLTTSNNISMEITNKGLGTAFVTDIEYFVSNEKTTEVLFYAKLGKFFRNKRVNIENSSITRLYKHMYLSKDEVLNLFNIFFDFKGNNELILDEYAVKFKIVIHYECAYGLKKVFEL